MQLGTKYWILFICFINFNDDISVNSADAIGILRESLKGLLSKNTASLTKFTAQDGPAIIYTREQFDESANLLSVPVYIENRTDICGMDLSFEYNTMDYTLLDVSSGKATSLLVKNMEQVKLSTINLDGLQNEKGQIVCFYFKPINNKTNNKIKILFIRIKFR